MTGREGAPASPLRLGIGSVIGLYLRCVRKSSQIGSCLSTDSFEPGRPREPEGGGGGTDVLSRRRAGIRRGRSAGHHLERAHAAGSAAQGGRAGGVKENQCCGAAGSQAPTRRPDWTSVMVMFLPPMTMAIRPSKARGMSL